MVYEHGYKYSWHSGYLFWHSKNEYWVMGHGCYQAMRCALESVGAASDIILWEHGYQLEVWELSATLCIDDGRHL